MSTTNKTEDIVRKRDSTTSPACGSGADSHKKHKMSDTAQNNGVDSGINKPELIPQNSLSSNMPESEVNAVPETSNLNTTAQTVTTAAQQVLSEEASKPAEELAKAKAETSSAVPVASTTSTKVDSAKPTNSTSSKSKTANIKQYRPSNSKIISQIATPGVGNKPVKVQYCNQRVIGNGSFGVVYRAELCGDSLTYPDSDFEDEEKADETNNKTEKEGEEGESTKKKPVRWVAIKKVLQDKRFKNRELTIMRTLKHTNICKLKYFFYSMGEQKDEVYLNLILEYVPENVYKVSRHYAKQKTSMPSIYVRLYMYQLLRALAYIHTSNICHRDIKPQNLLVNPHTAVLKLCDFGSAKQLVAGEPNVSYICSRYYRAPELIFGATNYTCSIDVWSAGCVLAELMLGQPIFPGDSGVDQLVEIIKLLGTPSREAIKEMNPNYTEFKFPTIKAHPWSKVFKSKTPETAIALCSCLLEYSPKKRLGAFEALTHSFFDDIRKPGLTLPTGNVMPLLFNYTQSELEYNPPLNNVLIPSWYKAE